MACAEVCFSGRPEKGTARASEVMKLFRTIVYTVFILAVLVALIVKNQREKTDEPPRETSGICTPCPPGVAPLPV